jgi:hypothetical protein
LLRFIFIIPFVLIPLLEIPRTCICPDRRAVTAQRAGHPAFHGKWKIAVQDFIRPEAGGSNPACPGMMMVPCASLFAQGANTFFANPRFAALYSLVYTHKYIYYTPFVQITI